MIAAAEQRVRWEQNRTRQVALEFILRGQRELAHMVMMESLFTQARWLSADDFELQPEYVWPST